MKTWFTVITNDYVGEGSVWDINKTGYRLDHAVFSSLEEVVKFADGKCAFDAIDNSQKLRAKDEIVAIYCILADDYIAALDRSWSIMTRDSRY